MAQAAIDMKSDLNAYEFKTPLISRVVPAPQLPDRAMPKHKHQVRSIDNQANFEQLRTSAITRKTRNFNYNQGRLYSHFKLEEMRREIQSLKDKESKQKAVKKKELMG
jgi:hypothetical protein